MHGERIYPTHYECDSREIRGWLDEIRRDLRSLPLSLFENRISTKSERGGRYPGLRS